MQSSNEEFVRFLGEGSFGSVNLVRYSNPNGSSSSYLSAVKSSHQEDCDSLQSELKILLELKGYPNIVTCLGDSLQEGFSELGDRLYKLQLEYASEGSLTAFMDKYPDRKLPEPLIKDFTKMILRGLVSVHGHGYVHCDIKPDNILVFPRPRSSSYEVKISDFGNALEVGEVPMFWGSGVPWVGTPLYMPPESVRYGVVYRTLDLWSVGCLVLEMYTGVSPWEGVRLDLLATRLRCGEAPEIPESLPSDAKDFIQTCFSRELEERGSAYELLSHPFLPRSEVEEEEEEDKKTRNSFLLKLFRRRSSNKKPRTDDAVVISEKKPLNLRFFPAKASQFKTTLNQVLRLKFIPLKKSTNFNSVSVH
ncbi:Protein kinase superfamily protein [Raphanus sativus]|uniref:Mitogen-activated protein kinase kinase kinase 20-like n=1 Tax=Raphanus sativus TaxID=3726 RepID=A0A9W3CRK3_RAPSA|nr:mitogen-activated protein kinase kinase kinase 20-like [Raphanus sativus]KAJ4870496.1 Protein kinase superfamily protein [Raphanus sativus]